uniref:HTH CENPB-type domain-containing protein n=1 Tax=Peronospora matthiolae TaxID=2874970 RepID=A0AAV1VND2_9STRA
MLKRPLAESESASALPPSPSSAAKKKRRSQPMGNLTNLQKRQLCIKFSQVKMTQQELCQWAKREFQLAHLPHQSTISKILARTEELTQMAPRDLSARRKGLVTHPELDTALCNWVLCARHNGLKISGDIIKSQARALAAQLGITSTMSFSNGWLGGFKKRYNIRLGTAASAMDSGSHSVAMMASQIHSLEQLQHVARMYDPRDVYCMQETGLCYELSPEKPAGRARAVRKETSGERLTIVLAVNADASDKMEPMFIGPCKLPVLLTEELDTELRHFYYQNNRRAWMTPVMFQDYVSAIDTRMRDEGRYVLLLASPAPSHVSLGLELTNVRLEILPSSMTEPLSMVMQVAMSGTGGDDTAGLPEASEYIAAAEVIATPVPESSPTESIATQTQAVMKIQPETEMPATSVSDLDNSAVIAKMVSSLANTAAVQPFDAGIIGAFKRRYRRYHMLYALDRFEAGRTDVFHVKQLQAMRWVRHCWKQELPDETIRKCWAATEILVPKPIPETMAAFESIEEDIDKEICETVSALDILRPLPIDEFVSPRDESFGIHCAGLEETDFVFTVPDSSDNKQNVTRPSPGVADAVRQQVVASTGLTPRLQELHARIEASASSAAVAASTLSLAPNTKPVVSGENIASVPTSSASAVDVPSLPTSSCTVVKPHADGPATNEQLIGCFKMLLPELDRLRFDDHTKKSIRNTFRKLKETVEQQALDCKRGTTKKAQPPQSFQPQPQSSLQEQQAQVLQIQQLQQMQQQLMMQPDQAIAMAAQTSRIGEDTML